jgi:hypothetical protein
MATQLLEAPPAATRDHAATDSRTVVNCYSVFDRFFPTCGMLDYSDGLYDGPDTGTGSGDVLCGRTVGPEVGTAAVGSQ